MDRNTLIAELRAYKPWNEQEHYDREEIIRQLETIPQLYVREDRNAHMTASSWLVNAEKTKALMIYHNIYNSWSWCGGHADGDEDLLSVAMREVREETGVLTVRPVSEKIFSVEILTVDGHEKHGKYVSSHLHLNITYLLEADESEALHKKEDENSGVAWFTLDDAVKASTEPWFRARIYSKLNAKLRTL